jgi:hypothetical protein
MTGSPRSAAGDHVGLPEAAPGVSRTPQPSHNATSATPAGSPRPVTVEDRAVAEHPGDWGIATTLREGGIHHAAVMGEAEETGRPSKPR